MTATATVYRIAGEPALANMTIRLYTQTDQLIATGRTDNSGHYLFAGLSPNAYFLLFDSLQFPTGYSVSKMDQGSDDTVDSDADPMIGSTLTFTLAAGATDVRWAAGLVFQSSLSPTAIDGTSEPAIRYGVWLPLIGK